jgi:hypothetical protein
MFLESSRYYKQKTIDIITGSGRAVKVLTLRKIPNESGKPTVVKGNDRLDIMSLRLYKDAARFWHIADANTELDASDLVRESGRIIKVPEQ